MLAQRRRTDELPKGLDAAWTAATGLAGRVVPRQRRFLHAAERVQTLEKQFTELTDAR